MNRGAITLALAGCAVVAGCAGGEGELAIRAKDPAAALRAKSGSSLDLARGQLAIGNVGLALEGFRRAAREQPASAEPLRGIAACYDAMGRHDLAQSNYEAALALAPRDVSLLKALAISFERRGRAGQAAAIRAEVGRIAAAEMAQATEELAADASAASIATPVAMAVAVTTPPAAQAEPKRRPPEPRLQDSISAPRPTVTVAIPLPRAVQSVAPAVDTTPGPVARLAAAKPKLERMSPGEVALLTSSEPAWKAVVVAQSRQSTTVRFVPLRTATARPNIRLLNAARKQGLAALSRDYLVDRGWRRIAVGDAPRQRERSIVIYPAQHAIVGRRLAAQFGFQSRAAKSADEFVVYLGRDAAAWPRLRKLG